MSICKNCRFWDLEDDNRFPKSIPEGWGRCVLAESIDSEAQVKTSRAFAIDDDFRTANLITAPDFGCIQFEAKQP